MWVLPLSMSLTPVLLGVLYMINRRLAQSIVMFAICVIGAIAFIYAYGTSLLALARLESDVSEHKFRANG